MSALIAVLAPLIKLLFTAVLPAVFELKEKSLEAVEAERDPAADDKLWSLEQLS